jgi:septum formation protein
MKPIILASASPRRHQLLSWAEIPYEVVVQPTDESYPSSIPIEEIPVFIAKNKALEVQKIVSDTNRIILAADTVVVIDQEIIGKPESREHAIDILKKISGRAHQVITGVVMLRGEQMLSFADMTKVLFHPLSLDQIEYYVDTYKPFDKAGAYAIQEWIGVVGIASIEGDFYNVMGLPVSRVVQQLSDWS